MRAWQTCTVCWASIALQRSSKSRKPSDGKRSSITLTSEGCSYTSICMMKAWKVAEIVHLLATVWYVPSWWSLFCDA
jgi:hypothetical protein